MEIHFTCLEQHMCQWVILLDVSGIRDKEELCEKGFDIILI